MWCPSAHHVSEGDDTLWYGPSMLPLASFGRTGHESTRIIFGAAALGAMSQVRADATLTLVADAGVNHIDTAASYGDAEMRLRPFLSEHRHEVFLATKTGERDGVEARRELETSLERMGVDRVDLIQLHNLVEPGEWTTAFAGGGVVEALAQARSEGLVGHIGVTGHGTRIAHMHRRSLDEFDFDSVLFPYNHSLLRNEAYAADVDELRSVCRERNVAMQTIKSVARGRWPDRSGNEFSWYEPLTDAEAIGRAVRLVLGNDDLFLNTTSDARLLPIILEAAQGDLTSPETAEMDADIDQFGITPLFDGGALERI